MKIVFMGTPEFAVYSLDALAGTAHEIVGVVSQPDKPKGRGHKLAPTPVKAYAQEHGLAVYQPETLRNHAFLETLETLAPDLIVVAAYGKILPEYILHYPKYGCINVHASLLPKYRGAAPIQRCIMNGESETGATIMYMEKGIDTGDMLLKAKTPVGSEETASALHDRLAAIGAGLLAEAVEALVAGNLIREKQDDTQACHAAMIDKSTALIDWSKPAYEIKNLIRAMNSRPLAYTYYNGAMMKIARAATVDGNGGTPGQVMGYIKGEGLTVACGRDALLITEVQFEGKRLMHIDDYMQGHHIEAGTVLGIGIDDDLA